MPDNRSSYASEIEFNNGVTYSDIRKVIIAIVNYIGSEKSIRHHVDNQFMDEVRHSDHDVVDVNDLVPYKGTIMHKADGMKVYVFC